MFEVDKTRKHFVPKLYLRGFCLDNPPKRIYVLDKGKPQDEVAVRSINNVEVSRDAYSVANDAILQEREDAWSETLKILKGRDASELNELVSDRDKSAELRYWLARLVVDSKLRSRGFRSQMRESANEIRLRSRSRIEALEADFRSRFPDLGEQIQIMVSLFKDVAGIDNDREFEALRICPFLRGEEGEKLYRLYEEGSWRFDAACDRRKFITSDIPSNSLLLGPEPEYRNWMWFVMPLSAELRLVGLCGDARMESGLAPRMGDMGNREMDIANVCVFQSAQRFVYASSKDELLRASEQSTL
ncbi:MAG: DUF4238 domain-containing protein [Chloroflexota bacterium]|nr:DUF4238 domain-containing protein [Chloroflexota bacterium]